MAPTSLHADRLIEACGDLSVDAGITIRTTLEPLAGPGPDPVGLRRGHRPPDRRGQASTIGAPRHGRQLGPTSFT